MSSLPVNKLFSFLENDKNILILQCGGAFPPSTATAPALSVDILMTVAPAVLKNANMI